MSHEHSFLVSTLVRCFDLCPNCSMLESQATEVWVETVSHLSEKQHTLCVSLMFFINVVMSF